MANLKDIKSKIDSTKNIKKITRALEVVSTVKLQKIKHRTKAFKEFMKQHLRVLNCLKDKINIYNKTENIDYDNPRLIIVITSDKGLCGSLNSKLLKHINKKYGDSWKDQNDIYCIGKQGFNFFKRRDFNIVGHIDSLDDDFTEEDLRPVYDYLTKSLDKEHKYCKIKVYFNYFENALNQIPLRFKVYPLDKESFEMFLQDLNINQDDIDSQIPDYKEMSIEPDLETVRQEIIKQISQHIVFGAVLQNKTGEFASRMIAMKNATDNAKDMIDDLTLSFNKARQAAITQEISEINGAKVAMGN